MYKIKRNTPPLNTSHSILESVNINHHSLPFCHSTSGLRAILNRTPVM